MGKKNFSKHSDRLSNLKINSETLTNSDGAEFKQSLIHQSVQKVTVGIPNMEADLKVLQQMMA